MSICTDNDLCMAIGKNRADILNYFEFASFKYATSMRRINLSAGANGLIHLIAYHRDKYDACAVLKTTVSNRADNLMFEYVVGTFINGMNRKFRCFIETFGMYAYTSEGAYKEIQSIGKSNVTASALPSKITRLSKLDLVKACAEPTKICLLIQCIRDSKSLYDKMESPDFIRNHLISVLYQVYYPLAEMAKYFTHYDLHLDNIVVIDSPETMTYEYGVHFTSPKIAKIIDYGRCYFKTPGKNDAFGSSEAFYKMLCAKCKQCGEESGFNWFADDGNEFDVVCTKVNESHDLLALYKLKTTFGKKIQLHNPRLHAMLQKLNYTKPQGTPHLVLNDGKINSVADARAELELLMRNSSESVRSAPRSIPRSAPRSIPWSTLKSVVRLNPRSTLKTFSKTPY